MTGMAHYLNGMKSKGKLKSKTAKRPALAHTMKGK